MIARMIFAVLAFAAVMLIQPHSANSAPYWPWCSQYGGDMGAAHYLYRRSEQHGLDTRQRRAPTGAALSFGGAPLPIALAATGRAVLPKGRGRRGDRFIT